MALRKEPERSCIGCGAKRAKGDLVRIVLDRRSQPVVDPGKAAKGRGAYVCGRGCLSAAYKQRALQRAFRGKMERVDVDIKTLEAALVGPEPYVKETRS